MNAGKGLLDVCLRQVQLYCDTGITVIKPTHSSYRHSCLAMITSFLLAAVSVPTKITKKLAVYFRGLRS